MKTKKITVPCPNHLCVNGQAAGLMCTTCNGKGTVKVTVEDKDDESE